MSIPHGNAVAGNTVGVKNGIVYHDRVEYVNQLSILCPGSMQQAREILAYRQDGQIRMILGRYRSRTSFRPVLYRIRTNDRIKLDRPVSVDSNTLSIPTEDESPSPINAPASMNKIGTIYIKNAAFRSVDVFIRITTRSPSFAAIGLNASTSISFPESWVEQECLAEQDSQAELLTVLTHAMLLSPIRMMMPSSVAMLFTVKMK